MKFRIFSLLLAVQMLFGLRLFAQVDISKTYFIQAKHSGLVWDVANNSNDLYAVINQFPLHRGPNQQWKFSDAGDGYYFIQSQNAGKWFASIELGKGSPGTRMCTEMQWVGDYNKFRLVPAGDGYYKIIVKHTGYCMQVPSAEMGPTTLTQFPWVDGANHLLWKLVPTVEVPVKAQFDLSVPYKIQGKESGMWWEVIDNSQQMYAPIGQAAHKDVANQQWKFVDAGDGYYFIQSQNPAGLFASIQLGNTAADARFVTEMQWVGDYTKFKIIPYGNPFDGTYKIIAKHSGMCVQVPGGGYGTEALTQYPYQEGANHHLWRIFPSKPIVELPSFIRFPNEQKYVTLTNDDRAVVTKSGIVVGVLGTYDKPDRVGGLVFKTIPLGGNFFAFRSINGRLLSMCSDCLKGKTSILNFVTFHETDTNAPGVRWEVTKLSNGKYLLKSQYNGQYMHSCPDCSDLLKALGWGIPIGVSGVDPGLTHQWDLEASGFDNKLFIGARFPQGHVIWLDGNGGGILITARDFQGMGHWGIPYWTPTIVPFLPALSDLYDQGSYAGIATNMKNLAFLANDTLLTSQNAFPSNHFDFVVSTKMEKDQQSALCGKRGKGKPDVVAHVVRKFIKFNSIKDITPPYWYQ